MERELLSGLAFSSTVTGIPEQKVIKPFAGNGATQWLDEKIRLRKSDRSVEFWTRCESMARYNHHLFNRPITNWGPKEFRLALGLLRFNGMEHRVRAGRS